MAGRGEPLNRKTSDIQELHSKNRRLSTMPNNSPGGKAHLVALKNRVYMTGIEDSESMLETDAATSHGLAKDGVPMSRTRALYENSYRILPEPSSQFYVGQAKLLVDALLTQQLEQIQMLRYEPEKAKKMCLQVANTTRKAVRTSLHVPRYKLVVYTVVGQNAGQDFNFASRCLWFPQTDNYVQSDIKIGDFFAICAVFAVYYE